MQDEEQELLQRLKAGEGAAFVIFYKQTAPRWVNYFTNRKRHWKFTQEEAEDVVQEAMLVIFNKISSFKPEGKAKFSSWCFRVALYKALDLYKTKRLLVQIEVVDESKLLHATSIDEELDHQGDTIHEDELEFWLKGDGKIQRALRSVSREEQNIVLWKVLRGLTHEEIASKLGKSTGALRVQFHRTTNKLKGYN